MGASQWDMANFNKNKVWNICIRLIATGFHHQTWLSNYCALFEQTSCSEGILCTILLRNTIYTLSITTYDTKVYYRVVTKNLEGEFPSQNPTLPPKILFLSLYNYCSFYQLFAVVVYTQTLNVILKISPLGVLYRSVLCFWSE